MTSTTRNLTLADEVRQALAAQQPVVALESTIISHGMPYPQNVETARRVEQTVRDAGAVPATVAILKGRATVGVSADQLEHLGREGTAIEKCSRRDLPFAIARGQDGATTVASTMMLAHGAGIPIMATGGIGGVHRDVNDSLDVSADLVELANTPVAVVCSGVKSILDIPRTLEYLETQGVAVAGYQTQSMPAFYCQDSGLSLYHTLADADDAAAVIDSARISGLKGGMVIAVPAPASHAIPQSDINQVIDEAIVDMQARNITGKETTPFLLARIAEKTAGKSLQTNIELVVNNARVGAEIAVALSRGSE